MNSNPHIFLHRIDRLSRIGAWGMGLALGGVGGALFLLPPAIPGTLGFIGLLALAFWLARSGRPMPFEAGYSRPAPAEPEPAAVEDPLWASIPGGRFRMGSDEHDREKPVHEVVVSAFRCLRAPVTRKLYREVTGKDPGWPEGEADTRPANRVNWFEAVEFCNRWSQALARSACFHCKNRLRAAGRRVAAAVRKGFPGRSLHLQSTIHLNSNRLVEPYPSA